MCGSDNECVCVCELLFQCLTHTHTPSCKCGWYRCDIIWISVQIQNRMCYWISGTDGIIICSDSRRYATQQLRVLELKTIIICRWLDNNILYIFCALRCFWLSNKFPWIYLYARLRLCVYFCERKWNISSISISILFASECRLSSRVCIAEILSEKQILISMK